MKVLACVLLSVIVAVTGRSSGVNTSLKTRAEPGSNPWLVHLRLAVSTSGYLRSCAGSLIDQSWVLTSADCARNLRFAWIRYGTTTVINPALVTESSLVTIHPQYNPTTRNHNIALININRVIQKTDLMSWVPLAVEPRYIPNNMTFCSYGAEHDGSPGEQLSCSPMTLESDGNQIVATSTGGDITEFDTGSPLVLEGVQVGILSHSDEKGYAIFTKPHEYISWMNGVTGLDM